MNGSPIKRSIVRREPSTPRKAIKTSAELLTPGSTPQKLKLDFSGISSGEISPNETEYEAPPTPTKERKVSEDANNSNNNSVYFQGKALFQRGSKIRKVVGRDTEHALINSRLSGWTKKHTNGALYVSGLPGTGKSALISEVLDGLRENANIHIASINCMTIDKPDQTYAVIAKEFGYLDRKSQKAREVAVELLQKEFTRKKTSHILVLDELDRIVTTDQEVLFKIFEWACGSGTNLIVIGIANAIDLTDRFLPRLQAHKLKPEVIAFKPYTAQAITEIIEARLRQLDAPLMHPAAVRICAAKTAANSGDLRKAFDICRRAIEVVEEESNVSDMNAAGNGNILLSGSASAPAIVTTRHVAKVCQSAFGGIDARQRLQLLNFQQRAVLCVLLKTERTSSQPNITVIQAFQEYEARCRNNAFINSLAYPEYMEVVNALESTGLVAVTGLCGKKGLGTHGNVRTSRGGGGAAGSKGAEGYRDEFGLRKISSRAQIVDVLSDLADNDPLRAILMD